MLDVLKAIRIVLEQQFYSHDVGRKNCLRN